MNVSNGYVGNNSINANTDREVLAVLDAASKSNSWLKSKGIESWQRGTGNIVENGFTFCVKSNGKTCRFNLTRSGKGTRQQAVTQTSKAAYHTIDFTTQRGKIAEAIWNESKAGKDVTRQELSILHGFEKNAVCGRVNELLKASQEAPFEFEGRRYRLVVTEPRLSRFKGASNVKNEGLRWWPVEAEQTKLF